MKRDQLIGMDEIEEVRRIEINFERVAVWTLIFTNSFFISYFLAKLSHFI